MRVPNKQILIQRGVLEAAATHGGLQSKQPFGGRSPIGYAHWQALVKSEAAGREAGAWEKEGVPPNSEPGPPNGLEMSRPANSSIPS